MKPNKFTDHNLYGAEIEKREIDSALEEFRLAWPRFLRDDLGITLTQLRSLDTSVLMALVILRLHTLIGERLNGFEARMCVIEGRIANELDRHSIDIGVHPYPGEDDGA